MVGDDLVVGLGLIITPGSENVIALALAGPSVDLKKRKDFLEAAQMTWDLAAANYVKTYFELIDKK